MSKRAREAERLFGDALRNQTAVEVKATSKYKALAHARKVERRWWRFGLTIAATMCAVVLWDSLRVTP